MASGERTIDRVPSWRIVNLTGGLLVVAFLRLITQIVVIVSEVLRVGNLNLTLYLISAGVSVAATVAVIIACLVNIHSAGKPRGCKFVCVILTNRFAAIVCAINAVCLRINLQRGIELESPMWSHLAHSAAMFLTVSESALSLFISYICLTCYDLERRQVAFAFLHMIIGGGLLPFIVALALSTTSHKLEWSDYSKLLAWSVFFVVFGVWGVFSAHLPRKCIRVVYVIMTVLAALITKLLILAITFVCIIHLIHPASSLCITNMSCSHLQAGFCYLCWFLAIDEFVAILMTIKATYIIDPHNNETHGGDMENSQYGHFCSRHGYFNSAALERQDSLPPSYEEMFPVSGASGEESNYLASIRFLEREESLPPHYENVINVRLST